VRGEEGEHARELVGDGGVRPDRMRPTGVEDVLGFAEVVHGEGEGGFVGGGPARRHCEDVGCCVGWLLRRGERALTGW
jgi:hypothetical protein